MRLKVGLVVAAILAFGAQTAVAGTPDSSSSDSAPSTSVESTVPASDESTTTDGSTTTASATTEPAATPAPATAPATTDGAGRPETDPNVQPVLPDGSSDEGPGAAVGRPGNRGPEIQVVPTPAPPPTLPPVPPDEILPPNSGSGRRIVYYKTGMRVWLIDENETVVKTHLVSGRLTWNQPAQGVYSVFSRSLYTCAIGNSSVCWKYMVRFTYGPGGLAIGFHEIPTNLKTGQKLQTIEQLGTPRSAGCVRQAPWDAKFLWDWAPVGTQVVVIQ